MSKIERRLHKNDRGEVLELEGNARGAPPPPQSDSGSWAERTHPDHRMLAFDEEKMRASYLVDRRRLVPFIVPHRFEGADDRRDGEPVSLRIRKRSGFGIGLNSAYLSEIMGHIRTAPVDYSWGPMADTSEDLVDEPPEGTLARRLWEDVTREGTSWRTFFLGDVLEWMLTSPGGFVLVDIPSREARTEADEDALGKRPFARFVPWSSVEDWGTGDTGFRWVKIAEARDNREPRDPEDRGYDRFHLLYELDAQGNTIVGRYDDKGNLVADDGVPQEQNLGRLEDLQGDAVLPLVPVGHGTHPDAPYAGDGLLRGLDDIVLDLWNQVSEIREEYRDIAFSFIKYAGGSPEEVADALKDGSRFVHYGTDSESTLERDGADAEGIRAGLDIVKMALEAWALTAKRKAQEAVSVAGPRSGESIKAEFAVDIRPLLTSIADSVDTLELRCMHLMSQLAGNDPASAGELMVERDREFQVEEEASRISSIVSEFKSALPRIIPGALQSEILMRWAESLPFVDLSQEVETEAGTETLREQIRRQVDELAEGAQAGQRNEGPFGFPNLNELEGQA